MGARIAFGTVLAIIGAVAGAVLWAAITASTKWQIGYMAVGVGLLAGYAMRFVGGGTQRIEGIIAAVVSLAGCVLGNLLTAIVVVAQHEHWPIPALAAGVLSHPAIAGSLLKESFEPMDLLFYAIAVYAGYRAALQPVRPAPAAIETEAAPPPTP